MACQNAWQLYKRDGGSMDQLAFRRIVLLDKHKKAGSRPPVRKNDSLLENVRYDNEGHLISYKENQNKCAFCHKKAQFFCLKCDKTIHPKDCFLKYHTM